MKRHSPIANIVLLVAAATLAVVTAVYMVRHKDAFSPQSVREVKTESLGATDQGEARSSTSEQRERTLEQFSMMSDEGLRAKHLPTLLADMRTLYSTDVDEVSRWRDRWGGALPRWTPEQAEVRKGNLEFHAARFAAVELDWEASQFFPVRLPDRRVVVPLSGYDVVLWDLQHAESNGRSGRVSFSADAEFVAARVPCVYHGDGGYEVRGFVLAWMTNGTPTGEWMVYKLGFAAPADARFSDELYYFRPSVK